MTKGGKRYANMDQDGKWFAHVGSQQSEVTRQACTTTGSMLSQAPAHMQAQERYPKCFINAEKKKMDRSYSFSVHDNRDSLQDRIDTYCQGLGRKKCLDGRRQHNSHFCLCHDGTVRSVWPEIRNHSAYQTDFQPKQRTESTRGAEQKRRFPRNHLEKSHQAAAAQAEENYMWFGRHDMKYRTPLSVLADANLSSTS